MATSTDHLWRHFTPAGAGRIVIERGEGAYIWDSDGNRYLDALSALYCVNIGYGPWPRSPRRQAAVEALPFFSNWVGFAHEPALALSDKLSELLPVDVGRIFFVGGGSEANEVMKLARQYHRLRGEADPHEVHLAAKRLPRDARSALDQRAGCESQFEPLLPGCFRAPMPYRYRCPYCAEKPGCTLRCADEIDDIVGNEGPETVAAVILEPVQNSGGSIVPPEGYFDRVREMRRQRAAAGRGRGDLWLRPRGRLVRLDALWHPAGPMTLAKGITSAYAPLGAVVASERAIEPFFSEPQNVFTHGITFGGHPLSCAIALANIEIYEREGLIERVRDLGPLAARAASSCWPSTPWSATCAATATSTRSSS